MAAARAKRVIFPFIIRNINCLDLEEVAAKARTVSISPELFFAAT